MKIEIILSSSMEGSDTKLFISNAEEGDLEALLTIDSSSSQQDIFVLMKDLKLAIDKLIL